MLDAVDFHADDRYVGTYIVTLVLLFGHYFGKRKGPKAELQALI